MARKKIHLPQHVQRTFLNFARANLDSQGHMRETLGFLLGYETEEALIVTDLVFPVQESSSTKVDDKGICGQDSSLWMKQKSPAAQKYKDRFRLIAWVHSHVEGAPCGFSSIDVHTQYAYRVMCDSWEVYGFVLEIKEDKSCITGWFDLTEHGLKCVSQCPVSQVQHGQCSMRTFFEDHISLVNEIDLPLTVIDGRNTSSLECNQPGNDPAIWTMNPQSSGNESIFNEHDVCKCCGKYLGNLRSMVGHIGRSKKCKTHYGSEYDIMRSKRRSESKASYNQANAGKIAKKQTEYNKQHRDEINAKQAEYNIAKREEIRFKQSQYNKDNRAIINKKQEEYDKINRSTINKRQQQYNQDNRSIINQKQEQYNKDNRSTINKRQEQYNRDNRSKIRKNQEQYNNDNRVQINKKQEKYDRSHKEQIVQKQSRYNQENKEEIKNKQSRYNQENKEAIKIKQTKYNLENKEEIKKKQTRYNQENQEEIKMKQTKYNKVNKGEINKKQTLYNQENKDQINKKQAKYNAEHRESINLKQGLYNKENRKDIAEKELKRKAAKKNPMKDFNSQIAKGPIFPCCCCHRVLFPDGVVKYSSSSELQEILGLNLFAETIHITDKTQVDGKFYLCINCNLTLKKGKMPTISVINGLFLDDIPDELKLTELEQQLIAKRLLFLKIHLLPRSKMPAMKDRVINVPLENEDICQTMQDLPRDVKNAGLIGVKFKRMKQLKSSHLQAFIRPGAPQKAIEMLKVLGHPEYQFDIKISQDINSESDSETLSDTSTSGDEDSHQKMHFTDGNESFAASNNKSVQHELYNAATCLVHDNLESEVVLNESDKAKTVQCGETTIEIAPGEGKIPTNILDEEDIDIKAFPTLFPSGKYGCDYDRRTNLSKQKYYNQRILNVDARFRNCPSYLFAAQHIVEREQLEKNINLMVQRGQLQKQPDGNHIMKTNDHYAAFQNIRGSPKYFQTARNELLARVAQLGPFQLFFTLSCAEMRWPEIITTLLQNNGYEVTCVDEEKLVYTVDGQSLEDFLEQLDTSKQDLFKDNIVIVSRMFDHRVKKFVQHLLKSPNEAISIDYYNYRVEFQMRGMAHVHGVIWLDEDQLQEYRMKNSAQYDSEKIPQLIDSLITCELPEADQQLRKIVQEVQTHHHTKTCRKYGSTCRFGYPRFPSKHTIVANPLPSDMDEKEQKTILDKFKEVLRKVRTVLESEENLKELCIDSLIEKAGVSYDDYKKALSTSERGVSIVLKRKVSDCFINNYNPTWLKSWNANMDLQFCYDPYAVITYICDYYGKDDSGMTDLLRQALRNSKGEGRHEILVALKKTYLTHRQIGACEATYRLLPNMHMKDSNITCTFVSTGFPENRATFMEKVHSDGIDEDNDDSPNNMTKAHNKLIKIEGKKGYFKRRIAVHERYSKRPESLNDMCLAQFATMYKVTSRNRSQIIIKKNSSVITGNAKIHLTDTELPVEIHFDEPGMSPMQLRRRSSVLRLHESKKKKEEHEYYYAELLLFHPWRDEVNDLHRNDSKKCKTLFKKNFLLIYDRRKIMFPYLDSVEEAQARLEEASLEEIRPNHISNTLDTERKHENDDDQMQEGTDSVDFSLYNPGEFVFGPDSTERKDFAQFKVVKVDLPEMMQLTRRLIPEQRLVLEKVVCYCKAILRSQLNRTSPPDSFRIILHGGAGSGKSNVIKIVAKWAEKILRKAGDHPNKPRILLTAPTGTAASIIGGITLHSAFNFSFGDELKPLSDKKLDELRCALSDVKIIIIDEISMIRSDLFYQLHLRLCEIFQCKKLFGGKSLMLVGDLLQLQPVRGSYIFDAPRCHRYKPFHEVNPLWQEFEVFTLNHNHRQGEAGHWAEALNRFRMGHVTEEDQEMLEKKVLSEDNAKQKQSACHIFFTNKEVDCHNTRMLNKLTTSLCTIKAAITVPFGCKSKLQASGRVDQTAFMDTLSIKIGARVMLIHNLCVIDNLTNGAMGKVLDIKLHKGMPSYVIVKFDNEEVGVEQRMKHEDIAKVYKKDLGTPIFKSEIQYQLPRGKKGTSQHTATGKLYQFPLRLAWAVTAHKVQGQTFKKNSEIVVHWHKNLAPGMAYVMLGRCESPNDVFISGNFSSRGIKCNEKAKEMAHELQSRSICDTKKTIWRTQDSLKIILINARSLSEHEIDIKQCKEYEEADILCVTETWLRKGETVEFDLLTHSTYASHNRGNGCALFSKNFGQSTVLTVNGFQCIKIQFPQLQIVLLYRCNDQPLSGVLEYLTEQVNFYQPSLLLGDFNIHADNQNILKETMKKIGLVQKIKEPTHDCGNILDHVYISESLAALCYSSLVPVTFSDHDLVKIEIVL